MLKLEERRRGHPNKPAPKIRQFRVVPKDTPTVYKPPSSVSSGTSFSSRRNDFIEDSAKETTAAAKPPAVERVPITIPIHKPLNTNVTSRRESFRVRPSLDSRQSIGRASLIGRATLESSAVAPVVTGQKRRLEQVLAQESNAPTEQDATMEEVDAPLADLASVYSATSLVSNNQSRLETSTYRSMVTESVISEQIPLSSSTRNTPEAIVDDRQSSSTPVRDASPVASLQDQPSPQHSIHHSPACSPSVVSSKRSVSVERSSPRQPSTAPAPIENEGRSVSVQSRTASPAPQSRSPQRRSMSVHSERALLVSQSRSPSVEQNVESVREESTEKEIMETIAKEQVEDVTLTEKGNLEDIASLSLEEEVFENTVSETKHDALSDKGEPSVDMETNVHEKAEEVNAVESMSHISTHNEVAQTLSPKQVSAVDKDFVQERPSPSVEHSPQNNQEEAVAQEEITQQASDIPEGAFDIDVDEDIDYNDYTMPENDVQQDPSEGEYLGEITAEEISMRAKEIAASMDTQLKRLVASKLGDLHVESLHKLTMEAVRTLRNTNTDPYARSVIEDFVSKLSESYDKCHADYNEYLKITNSREKLEKLANSTRFADAAIERERLQIQRKLEKSNKEVSALDVKIQKLEELDDFWGSVKNLVNPSV